MNYYKEITKLLGLHWDEEKQESEVFKIKTSKDKLKITDEGLLTCYRECWNWSCACFTEIKPENIIKLPWIPELEETYYYPSFNHSEFYSKTHYDGHALDERIIKAVGAFRTPEEALKAAKEMWGL